MVKGRDMKVKKDEAVGFLSPQNSNSWFVRIYEVLLAWNYHTKIGTKGYFVR